MNAMIYLVWRSVIGLIRNIKKKKGQLVLVIYCLVMFVLVIVAGNRNTEFSQWIPDEFLAAVFAGIVLLLTAYTINRGIKKGSSSYRKADIQFVFPSPISPKLILIYGFLKQLAISILITLWFVFQTFTIRNLFGLSVNGFFIFLLTVFLVVIYMPISSMWLYSITLRNKGAKRIFSYIYSGIGIILAAAVIFLTIYKGDPIPMVKIIFGGNYFQFIPIIGWLVSLLKAAKWGFTPWTWTALSLLIAGIGFILWKLLSSEIPFYEEVLKQTDEKEKQIAAKRSGSSGINLSMKKVRAVKVKYRGTGSKALFYRQLLEYKKAGFLFFDKATLIMLVLGIAGGFLLKNFNLSVQFSLYAAIYLNFIFAFGGKWVTELSSPIIYLIPGSALSKLWYATAANHIKHIVDGAAVFLPITFILKLDLLSCIGYILAYAAIGALYIYADILGRRIFGSAYNGVAATFFKLLCILIILMPALIGFIIVTIISSGSLGVLWLALFGVSVYSALISVLIMLFGKKIFESAEL